MDVVLDWMKHQEVCNEISSIDDNYISQFYLSKDDSIKRLGHYYNSKWKIPILCGNIDLRLDGIVNNDKCNHNFARLPFNQSEKTKGAICLLVDSSGMGKTRSIFDLSQKRFVIYIQPGMNKRVSYVKTQFWDSAYERYLTMLGATPKISSDAFNIAVENETKYLMDAHLLFYYCFLKLNDISNDNINNNDNSIHMKNFLLYQLKSKKKIVESLYLKLRQAQTNIEFVKLRETMSDNLRPIIALDDAQEAANTMYSGVKSTAEGETKWNIFTHLFDYCCDASFKCDHDILCASTSNTMDNTKGTTNHDHRVFSYCHDQLQCFDSSQYGESLQQRLNLTNYY